MPDQPTTSAKAKLELLTPRDVAERLAVSRDYVVALIRRGDLEGYRIGERTWRVKPDALERFLSKRSTEVLCSRSRPSRRR